MESFKEVLSLFDTYSRQARLYPSLLTIAPLTITVILLLPVEVSIDTLNIVLAIVAFLGGFYFLSGLARSKGKSIENKLNESWGGWRTTVLLRHSDDHFDAFTKQRYHSALQEICGNAFTMPSPEEEAQDLSLADQKYRSASKVLIEKRRDKEHHLLHKENAQYGFWRNLLGLKSWTISLTIVSLLISLAVLINTIPGPFESFNAFVRHFKQEWLVYLVCIGNLVYLAFFSIYVNALRVLEASNNYASALFRSLD